MFSGAHTMENKHITRLLNFHINDTTNDSGFVKERHKYPYETF